MLGSNPSAGAGAGACGRAEVHGLSLLDALAPKALNPGGMGAEPPIQLDLFPFLLFPGLLQPVAVPVALDNMRFVGQPIQQGCGEVGIAKDLGPVAEAEIAGNNHRALFMAFSQDLEEQLGALFGERDVAKLIQDQQTIAGITLETSLEIFFMPGLYQFIGQATGGGKPGPDALAAGFHPEGGCQMGLAGAAFSQKDHVSSFFDIFIGAKMADKPPVQLRGKGKVKILDGFKKREACLLESSLEPVFRTDLKLMLGQLQQKIIIVLTGLSRLPQGAVKLFGHMSKLQALEVLL